VTVVESLLNVSTNHRYLRKQDAVLTASHNKADPKLARLKDEDGRLAIHWAASSNQPEIVSLLVNQKGFDPDVQVRGHLNLLFFSSKVQAAHLL